MGPERPSGTDAAALRARLRHVRWIGGGSGAGKSTTARRLAALHGLHLYPTDDMMADHARRLSLEDGPFLSQFVAMDMDERWATRSPETMLETFPWFRGEGFHLIVDDLLRLPGQPGALVEGFRLLPHLVEPLLSVPGQAAWLIPTPGFRRAAFDRRGSTWDIARRTSDPQRALLNLLERDAMFTDIVSHEAKRRGLQVIEVDTAMTEHDLAQQVADVFKL